jgi:hypothetical protein
MSLISSTTVIAPPATFRYVCLSGPITLSEAKSKTQKQSHTERHLNIYYRRGLEGRLDLLVGAEARAVEEVCPEQERQTARKYF